MNSRWAEIALTVLGMAIGSVVFTYSTFETKDEVKASVSDRLDRIETKLDTLIRDR